MGELSSTKMIAGGGMGSRGINYDDDLIDAPFSPPNTSGLIGYNIPARKSKFHQLQKEEEVPAAPTVKESTSTPDPRKQSQTLESFELPKHITASSRFHKKRGSDSFLLTQQLASMGPIRGGQAAPAKPLHTLGEDEAVDHSRDSAKGYKNISEWKPSVGSQFFQGFYKGPDRSKMSGVDQEDMRGRSTSDSGTRPRRPSDPKPEPDMQLGIAAAIALPGTTTPVVDNNELRAEMVPNLGRRGSSSTDLPGMGRRGSWFGSMFGAGGPTGNTSPLAGVDTPDFVKPEKPAKPKKVKKRDLNVFAPTSM